MAGHCVCVCVLHVLIRFIIIIMVVPRVVTVPCLCVCAAFSIALMKKHLFSAGKIECEHGMKIPQEHAPARVWQAAIEHTKTGFDVRISATTYFLLFCLNISIVVSFFSLASPASPAHLHIFSRNNIHGCLASAEHTDTRYLVCSWRCCESDKTNYVETCSLIWGQAMDHHTSRC